MEVLRIYPARTDVDGLVVARDPAVGDVPYGWGRGRYRAGVVVAVGPRRVTLLYTTESAVRTAAELGQCDRIRTTRATCNRSAVYLPPSK